MASSLPNDAGWPRRYGATFQEGDTMAMEQFVGRKTKKAWAMKPKRYAGASIENPQGGHAGEAKAKMKQVQAPKKDDKKKK